MPCKTSSGVIAELEIGLFGEVGTIPYGCGTIVETMPPPHDLFRLVWTGDANLSIRKADGAILDYCGISSNKNIMAWLLIVTSRKHHSPTESAQLCQLLMVARRDGLAVGMEEDHTRPTPPYIKDIEVITTKTGRRYYFPDSYGSTLMSLDGDLKVTNFED